MLALLLAGVGCGVAGSIPAPSGPDREGGRRPTLRVMPESFSLGGAAQLTARVSTAADGSPLVHIVADCASGLRAVLVELDYDPALWHPVSAASSGLLRSAARSGSSPLELTDFSQPGTAVYAQVLSHPEAEPGFSGSGVLATLRFAAGRSPASSVMQRSASISMGDTSPAPWRSPHVTHGPDRQLVMAYALGGDYDQNGEVNTADLLPLAQHLFEVVRPEDADTLLDVLDGDRNKEVNLADVAVIGRNFHQRVSYKVYRTRDFAELPWDFTGPVLGTSQTGYSLPTQPTPLPVLASGDSTALTGNPQAERLRAEIPLDDAPGYFYFVEICDSSGERIRTDLAEQRNRVFQHYWPAWRLAYDPAQQLLTHLPAIPGDYDRNSEVNVADLVPIGTNLNRFTADYPDSQNIAAIDGNGDGTINLKDMFIIRLAFMQRCDWINIYLADNAAALPTDPYAPSTLQPFAQSTQGRLEQFSPPSGSYVWLRPSFEGVEGPCSAAIQIP